MSEDIVVPLDRFGRRSRRRSRSGARHGLEACSWGHAGDGNLHSTFLVAPDDEAELERASSAAEELFELAVRLGGSISGEHGVGWVKRGQLARQWPPRALGLHEAVKRAFDPEGPDEPRQEDRVMRPRPAGDGGSDGAAGRGERIRAAGCGGFVLKRGPGRGRVGMAG